jgi:plasmid stabilization system protein ParE
LVARANPLRAASFVAELRDRCRRLTEFPMASPARPELGEEVRMALFGRYRIFYVVSQDVLEIRRVLHAARRPPDRRG